MYYNVYIPIIAKQTFIPIEKKDNNIDKEDLVMILMEEGKKDYGIIKNFYTKPDKKLLQNDWKIIQKCSPDDKKIIVTNSETTSKYLIEIKEEQEKLKLKMSIINVQLSFDNKMILITFSAEGRVDFRDLVKVLSQLYKKKIHLLQVGPRDKAQIIGGHGSCGRKQCCTNFLRTPPSVSMEAAHIQSLAFKGAESLSGNCGKLKCCLNYESEEYKRVKNLFPKFGTKIIYESMHCIVIGMDILNGKIKLKSEHNYTTITLDDYKKHSQKK